MAPDAGEGLRNRHCNPPLKPSENTDDAEESEANATRPNRWSKLNTLSRPRFRSCRVAKSRAKVGSKSILGTYEKKGEKP